MLSAIGNVSNHGWAPPRTDGPPQMNEVAKLLGLTGSELSSQLQSGKTLHSLASEKHVSSSELIKTIETELSTHKPEGAPALEPSQLTQIATSIANGTPPTGLGHIGGASSTQGGSSTLAQTLGMEPSELLAQLEEGLDPTSLVPSTGYTSDGSGAQQASSGGVAFNGFA
jgi:flagellar capping protein FliD